MRVDLDVGTLRVELTRTLVASDHGMEVVTKAPKSASGQRTLPLPPQVTAALKAFKATQAAEKLRPGEVYQDSGFVLVDELGVPQRTDWLRRRTYALMAAAKVRKVRPYDARHACLTYLATNGIPDVIVSAWAGHADLSLAKRVYVGATVREVAEKYNVSLRASSGYSASAAYAAGSHLPHAPYYWRDRVASDAAVTQWRDGNGQTGESLRDRP